MASKRVKTVIATAMAVCFLSLPFRIASAEDKSTSPAGVQSAVAKALVPDPIRDIIEAQLAAIDQRNADLVWSYATDKFHRKHKDAVSFLNQVRLSYRALYNHKSVTYLETHGDDTVKIQKIRVQDRYGTDPIVAVYRLERQVDGKWLIDSLSILLDTDSKPI